MVTFLIIFYSVCIVIPIFIWFGMRHLPSIFDRASWKAWKACYDYDYPVLTWSDEDSFRFVFQEIGYVVYGFDINDENEARTAIFKLGRHEPIVFSSYYTIHSRKMLNKLKKLL